MANLKELRAQIEQQKQDAVNELESKQRAERQRMNDMLKFIDGVMEKTIAEILQQYPEASAHSGIIGNKAKYWADFAFGKRSEKIKIL